MTNKKYDITYKRKTEQDKGHIKQKTWQSKDIKTKDMTNKKHDEQTSWHNKIHDKEKTWQKWPTKDMTQKIYIHQKTWHRTWPKRHDKQKTNTGHTKDMTHERLKKQKI